LGPFSPPGLSFSGFGGVLSPALIASWTGVAPLLRCTNHLVGACSSIRKPLNKGPFLESLHLYKDLHRLA
jgi:hypothetical protein